MKNVNETGSAAIRWLDRAALWALTLMLTVVVILSVVELGVIIGKKMVQPPYGMLQIEDLLTLFGFFLMVLIGLELLHSMTTYLASRTLQVEVVFMVALIAAARKVIILDTEKLQGLTLIGLAAVILAMSVGYYLIRKSHRSPPPEA